MEDQPQQVLEEIRQLKEDVLNLKQRVVKMHEDLEKASRLRRWHGSRRGRRTQSRSVPNPGRRSSDR